MAKTCNLRILLDLDCMETSTAWPRTCKKVGFFFGLAGINIETFKKTLPMFELLMFHALAKKLRAHTSLLQGSMSKTHVNFRHVRGTYFTIDASYLLWLNSKNCARVSLAFTWKVERC